MKGADMVKHYLDFEKPLIDLEREIEHLRRFSSGRQVHFDEHLRNLEEKLHRLQKRDIFQLDRLADYTTGQTYRPTEDIPLYSIYL